MSVRLPADLAAAPALAERAPACVRTLPWGVAHVPLAPAPPGVPDDLAPTMPARDASPVVTRVLAVGWSGARTDAGQQIWLCEVRAGRVVRLERGRSREALVAHVITEGARDPRLVVGFDFAFSFPAWFVAAHGGSAEALWRRALVDGDRWIDEVAPPFWTDAPGGSTSDARADVVADPFRRTEREAARRAGCPPDSAFHLGSDGSPGAAAIRGMPCLMHLRAAGFAVWPFDAAPPGTPTVVELWPPLCSPRRVDPAEQERRSADLAELSSRATALPAHERRAAECSDDAFATLAAAVALWEGRAGLAALPPARDVLDRLEGRIWQPDTAADRNPVPETAGDRPPGYGARSRW